MDWQGDPPLKLCFQATPAVPCFACPCNTDRYKEGARQKARRGRMQPFPGAAPMLQGVQVSNRIR